MQRQPEILRLLRIIYKKFLVWSVFSPPCSRTLIILKLKKYLKLETLNFFLTSVKKRTNCPAIYGFDYTGYQRFFLRVAGIFGWSPETAAGGVDVYAPGAHNPEELLLLFWKYLSIYLKIFSLKYFRLTILNTFFLVLNFASLLTAQDALFKIWINRKTINFSRLCHSHKFFF